jgi:hypothetical protein
MLSKFGDLLVVLIGNFSKNALLDFIIMVSLLDLLPLLAYQTSIVHFKDAFDLIVSFLSNSDELHIVLLEVFCHILCIFEGRKHHIIHQLVDTIALRFEA